ncbi:MAG: glutamate--tRNA ligase [Phycisphaerales bacterium]|nr:glutamate--tRNA ligase [Phycisphaerales bacterium]
MSDRLVRVRFAPSPTGYLHIGGARTVLYNWLVARKVGGTFILRIEDTDRDRHVEDSVGKILEDLRWLGLTWDEGPVVGGPCAPYFQSERLDLYHAHARRLLESGDAYYAFETSEELEASRESARVEKRSYKYVRPSPLPTIAQGEAAQAAGKAVVVRFKMPGEPITVHDEILGDVVMPAEELEDFVILKSDGWPTYHFACVVDDELMRVTHVIRGQEHLMNTPKHIAMQRALKFATPSYAHPPIIFSMDGTKMSKRDKEKAIKEGRTPPEIEVHDFRVSGYLPEALLNFIALLGWSSGDDREHFSVDELIERFSIERVGKTNARFDRDKLLAFNTDWCAKTPPLRLLAAFKDFLAVNASPLLKFDDAMLARLLAAKKGLRTFRDVVDSARFLVQRDEEVWPDGGPINPDAVRKVLEKNEGAGYRTLEAILAKLDAFADWTAEGLHKLIETYCAASGAKMGDVAQPLRVAITGSTVSPPIGDSLALLGKDATCARIRRCLSARRGA